MTIEGREIRQREAISNEISRVGTYCKVSHKGGKTFMGHARKGQMMSTAASILRQMYLL